jgi:hypothetical protein
MVEMHLCTGPAKVENNRMTESRVDTLDSAKYVLNLLDARQ